MHGKGVPIVKVFDNAHELAVLTVHPLWTAIANHFPAKNELGCGILHIGLYSVNIFSEGHTPTHASARVLGPRHHQFPLCLSAFPLFWFYGTATAWNL